MNKVILLVICFFFGARAHSQINELGVFIGGSNYIGDVGATTFVDPNSPAIGLVYKWNRSPRHAWRFSYIQSKIRANDADSEEAGRNQRGLEFENKIKEFTGGIEFNFFNFDVGNPLIRRFTSYVFTGLSLSFYDGLFYKYNRAEFDSRKKTIAFPLILGVKSNITSNFVLGLEVGTRFTSSDNLDGSAPDNQNWKPLQFGNLNNNDWYVFSGLTLTYTFGSKPCFCAE